MNAQQFFANYADDAEAFEAKLATFQDDNTDALKSEGQFAHNNGKFGGMIAFLPSAGRASYVTNGDAVWFDADSLEQAVERVLASDNGDLDLSEYN